MKMSTLLHLKFKTMSVPFSYNIRHIIKLNTQTENAYIFLVIKVCNGTCFLVIFLLNNDKGKTPLLF